MAQFKTRFQVPAAETDYDAVIQGIIIGVGGQLAIAAGRRCLEKTEYTDYLSIERGCKRIYVPDWPIIDIASLKEGADGDFEDSDELTAGTDFVVLATAGVIYRIGGYWPAGNLTVSGEWTLGYTACPAWTSGAAYAEGDLANYERKVYACIDELEASETAPPDDETHWELAEGEFPLPDAIAEACLQQAGFTWQRRDKLGLTSTSVQGGSVAAYAQDELLPGVAEIMKAYRRMYA